jgi:hypothetical protein
MTNLSKDSWSLGQELQPGPKVLQLWDDKTSVSVTLSHTQKKIFNVQHHTIS